MAHVGPGVREPGTKVGFSVQGQGVRSLRPDPTVHDDRPVPRQGTGRRVGPHGYCGRERTTKTGGWPRDGPTSEREVVHRSTDQSFETTASSGPTGLVWETTSGVSLRVPFRDRGLKGAVGFHPPQ